MRKALKGTFFLLACICICIILSGCEKGSGKKKSSKKGDRPEKSVADVPVDEQNKRVRAALDQGDNSKAEKLAKKRIQNHPADAEAQYLMAKSLLAQGNSDKALEPLEKACALQPENISYKRTLAETLDELAQTAVKDDDTQKAIKCWKRCYALKYKPRQTEKNLAETYRRYGEILLNKKKVDDAEAAFREAVAMLPDNPVPRFALANLLLSSDRLLEAQRELKELVDGHPNYEPGLVAFARLLKRMGDIRGAMKWTDRVLEFAPENRDAVSLKTELQDEIPIQQVKDLNRANRAFEPEPEILQKLSFLESSGNLQAQITLLTQILNENPDAEWARLRKALVYERMGNASESLTLVSEFLESNPADTRALFLKARCMQIMGNLEEALNVLKMLEVENKANLQVFDELGQVYAKMGKFDEARMYWNKVLEVDPEYANVLFNFGQLAMENNNVQEARDYFERAIKKEPFNLKFRYFAGMNLKQGGLNAEAKTVWDTAKSFMNQGDPYSARILRALGEKVPESKIITVQPDQSEPEPAISENKKDGFEILPHKEQKSLPIEAEDPGYYAALESARSGDYQKAIDGFNQVIVKNPTNFNALMNLGKVNAAMGKQGEAAAKYVMALKIDRDNVHALKALAQIYGALGLHGQAAGINTRISDIAPGNEQTSQVKKDKDGRLPRSNPRAFEPITKAFLANGLAEEAVTIIKTGTEENPEMPELLILQGEVMTELKQFDLAETAFQKAMELDKQSPIPYVKMGDLFCSKQRYDLAYNQYESALKTKFIDPDTMFIISDRFKSLGKTQDAQNVIDKLKGMNLSDSQLAKLKERQGN